MILLTGASGMIGKNYKEMYPDCLSPSHSELDLTDRKQVKNYILHNNPEKIIHCASNDDEICLYDNLRMFINLAELKIPMITFCTGRDIEDRPGKVGEYILSKYIIQELALNKYQHIKIIKLWGCFGLYEKETRFFMENMLRVKQGLPILVKEDKYFSYVYVKDLINCVMLKKLKYYSVVTYTKKLSDYAKILKEVTGSKLNIIIESENVDKSYIGTIAYNLKTTPIETALKEMWDAVNNNTK